MNIQTRDWNGVPIREWEHNEWIRNATTELRRRWEAAGSPPRFWENINTSSGDTLVACNFSVYNGEVKVNGYICKIAKSFTIQEDSDVPVVPR